MEPSWRQERPRRAKLGQVGAKMGPSWGQVGPSWVQDDPKRAPREAKLSSREPSWSICGHVEGEGGDLLEPYVFPKGKPIFWRVRGIFLEALGGSCGQVGCSMVPIVSRMTAKRRPERPKTDPGSRGRGQAERSQSHFSDSEPQWRRDSRFQSPLLRRQPIPRPRTPKVSRVRIMRI